MLESWKAQHATVAERTQVLEAVYSGLAERVEQMERLVKTGVQQRPWLELRVAVNQVSAWVSDLRARAKKEDETRWPELKLPATPERPVETPRARVAASPRGDSLLASQLTQVADRLRAAEMDAQDVARRVG